MKYKVLFLGILVSFLFVSCSDNDDIKEEKEEIEEEEVIEEPSKLLLMTNTIKYNKGEISGRTEEHYIENKKTSSYNYVEEELGWHHDYEYNDKSLVAQIQYYFKESPEDTYQFTYDEQDRLIEIYSVNSKVPDLASYRVFDYPEDGTIREHQLDNMREDYPGGNFVYELNDLNLIERISNDEGDYFEAVYESNLIVATSSISSNTYSYAYEDTNSSQGDFYQKLTSNIFGKELNNAALYMFAIEDMTAIYADKFLILKESDDSSYEANYEWDSEGYPILKEEFSNTEKISSTTFNYE